MTVEPLLMSTSLQQTFFVLAVANALIETERTDLLRVTSL